MIVNKTCYHYLTVGARLILAGGLTFVTASYLMSDEELSAIDAQSVGAVSSFRDAGRGEISVDDLGADPRTAEEAFDILVTVLEAQLLSRVLDYDISVGQVVYGYGYGYGTAPVANSDGTLAFPLPSHIDYVRLERLRPAGADPAQSFGDVEINNIQIGRDSTITIQPMRDP